MTSTSGAAPRLDPALAQRATHRHWQPILPRFGDLDVLGHVSHVNLVRWFEEGRVNLELPIQPIDALQTGPVLVLAEMRVQFLEEAQLSDRVEVGTCVLRLGRSSVTVGQGIFAGDRCVAIAELVEVLIGGESRKPEPLPERFRAVFEQYLR
jgi:acyl-CoA thioester hydrolase